MNAWTTLGLKRTGDVAEIRRAYARKLKATDVEADPAAFIALRGALERALAYAASQAPGPDDERDDEDWSFDPLPALAEVPAAPAAGDPAQGGAGAARAEGEDRNARFARLETLLFGGDDSAADPEALAAAVQAIVDHPDMHHIEHDRAVQFWLADHLHAAIPRSDPVLAMVVDRFGWEQGAGQIDQPWLFEALVERVRAFALIEQLADPSHPHHRAWIELTRPGERLGFKPMGRGEEVGQLLRLIRDRCPPAEEMLAPHRVALWEEKLGRVGPARPIRWIILGIWGLWALSRIASCVGETDSPTIQAPSPQGIQFKLSATPAADYRELLDPILGRGGLAALQASHPALHQRLVDRWQEARDAGERRPDFQTSAYEMIDEAIGQSLRGGSESLQADFWRLHVDRLKWLRDNPQRGGFAACEQYASRAAPTIDFPDWIDERLRLLRRRALLEAPARQLERRAEAQFRIPGVVFEASLARSGLAEDTFAAALLDGGSPTERCNARIALLETALELPSRRREPFLREMSLGL